MRKKKARKDEDEDGDLEVTPDAPVAEEESDDEPDFVLPSEEPKRGFLGTLHSSKMTFDEAHEGEEDLGVWSDANSDDSDDEPETNRIGDVPLKWYEGEDHVGYDLEGERVLKTLKTSEIDKLLEAADNPDAWRTIQDAKNQREVVLSRTDLELIRRIRQGKFPQTGVDPHEMVEFTNNDSIHPVSGYLPPKSRFVPSKWEGMKVAKLVNLIRAGKIRPPRPPPPEVYDVWEADAGEKKRKGPAPIPPPKMPLPGHAESYNPPAEYLMTEDEKKEWEEMDETERPQNFIPEKHDCLRRVPLYQNGILERFHRCLDLYLCPRALKMRMNVDPKSLLPQLPSPKDLRPFPTQVSTSYDGHSQLIRSVVFDPTGRWVATASADGCRIFEAATSHMAAHLQIGEVLCLAWNRLLLAAVGDDVLVITPPVTPKEEVDCTGVEAETKQWKVEPEGSKLYRAGVRLRLTHVNTVSRVTWHAKGNFFAAVASKANPTKQCTIHNLATKKSLTPFKVKGEIQTVAFHPTKPLFFVASQRSVRVYDLQKQSLVKTLVSGIKHISSIHIHANGEHVLVGSYDRRLVWFDLELSTFPYKTLRYHDRAIRQVCFHPRYPLMASASDDGSVHVFHAKVLDDFSNPLVVPVKRLRGHVPKDDLGVMSIAWHPVQPWLVSAGGDAECFLWS